MYLHVSKPAPFLLGLVCVGALIDTITYHSRYLDALGANGAGEIHDSAQRAPTPFESSLQFSDRIHRLYNNETCYALGKAEDHRLYPI